ncbi:MAG: hypothetical protein GY870_13445 [archaeon]|nr:hypothetical protein [archaeon]
MIGWISLHRCLLGKAIWKHTTPQQKTILITLLLMADHQVNEWVWRGERFKTKPGQFITSLDSIVLNAGKGISVKMVRTSLKKFEKFGFLADKSTKTGRLITITNWDSYQDVEEKRAKVKAKKGQRRGKEGAANNNVNNVNNKKPKSGNFFPDESVEMKLTKYLFNHMKKNNPKIKEPNFNKWVVEIDRMIRIDKRNPEDIKSIINWCQNDSFWHANILSTVKLRVKYDQMFLKKNNNKPNNNQPGITYQEL